MLQADSSTRPGLARLTLFALISSILLCPLSAFAHFAGSFAKVKHKNDVVIMENGDRNTGEVKKMEFGILYLKSDRAADTLRLDWERVVRVESIARYEFETRDKEVYIGIIAKDSENTIPPGELQIVLDDQSLVRLKILEIISVREMGLSFFFANQFIAGRRHQFYICQPENPE